jgi:hypothetical protein
MTPLWWKLDEQPVRHLTWYSFNGWASIIGSLVAYALGHVTHSAVPTWALIFIVSASMGQRWTALIAIDIRCIHIRLGSLSTYLPARLSCVCSVLVGTREDDRHQAGSKEQGEFNLEWTCADM